MSLMIHGDSSAVMSPVLRLQVGRTARALCLCTFFLRGGSEKFSVTYFTYFFIFPLSSNFFSFNLVLQIDFLLSFVPSVEFCFFFINLILFAPHN